MKAKIIVVVLCLTAFVLASCATEPERPEAKAVLSAEVNETIAIFKGKDPDIQRFIDNAYAYAVLPKVFKGAVLVGGAHGDGEVYEQGNLIGYCSMLQATLGFSLGGEYFREVIFFQNWDDLQVFKSEEITFSAQVTGVAATVGAAAKTDYQAGMVVFITTDSGLMVDASLGGQKFTYIPKLASE
jgi:lipid-binding SYLF domain-containing protein